jgi:hypothetical protein
MKKFISIILLLAFSVNFSFAQKSRPGAATQMPVPKVFQLEIADEANNFSQKGLPVPPILGYNPSDKLAATLASLISAYNENSYPYLIATMQKAGFYILAENQKILYQPSHGKGMGLAFYDYELPGMYETSRAGSSLTVAKLGEILQAKFPELPKNKFAELILEDIRIGTKSKNREVRFWARLIVELGKNFPTPVDLMTATPENATINLIQASLIERRLIGDIIALATKQSAKNDFGTKPNLAKLFRPESKNVQFINASFSENLIKEPCNYSEVETLATDVQSTVATTAHGKVLELVMEGIGKSKEFIGNVGQSLGVASAVLSWAKLVAAASQVKGTITVEEPLPLIRTKSDKVTGEKRLLTGKFEVKVNDLRNLNCMRSAINSLTGLDFSMPSSGPLAEKPISWDLGGEVSFKGQNSSKTGEFDQIVFLKSPDGADYTKLETNGNGESRVNLEGGKQKVDLTNEAVVPHNKKAVIRADIALKNMKDSKQEAADLGGFGLGIAVGGVTPLGIISAIPEIANRMKIPAASATVPIRDWTPCSEDWGGTIDVTRTFSKTEVIKSSRKSNGNGTGDGVKTITENAKIQITLNPRTQKEIDAKVAKKPDQIAINGKHSEIFEGNRESDPCCGKTEGNWNTKFKEGKEHEFSAYLNQTFRFSAGSTEREHYLDFGDYLNFPTDKRTFLEVSDSNCQLEGENAFSKVEKGNLSITLSMPRGRYGQRFANSGGEIFAGQKTFNAMDGATYNWSWELARCK